MPLAAGCWARRRVSSGGASVTFKWWEEEPDTSRLLGITRDGEFPFQSFIGLCKCKVCRGREKVLAQRIYSIFYYFNVCNVHWDQRWNLTFRAEVFSEEDVEMSGTFSAKSHCYCELSLLGAKLRWWVGFWSPSSELVGNCQHWLFEHYITSKLCTWHHLTVYYVQQNSHLYVFIDRWHTNLSAAVGLRH